MELNSRIASDKKTMLNMEEKINKGGEYAEQRLAKEVSTRNSHWSRRRREEAKRDGRRREMGVGVRTEKMRNEDSLSPRMGLSLSPRLGLSSRSRLRSRPRRHEVAIG